MSETEWPQVGDRVAVYHTRGAHPPTTRPAHVARLTKTRIVLDNGEWFRRDSRERRGGGSWGWWEKLLAPDDERVTKARVEIRRQHLHSEIDLAHEVWRRARGTDDGTLLRALQASVEAALADREETK